MFKKMMSTSILLILAHLLVFNVLFTYRHAPQMALDFSSDWMQRPYTGDWTDYLKLYFSTVSDEANYYEWSSVVLGKTFEADYPLEERNQQFAQYRDIPPQVHLPYRDIAFEYPPVLIFPILLPRVLASNYLEYCHYLAALLSVFYLGILWISYKLWKLIPEVSKISFEKFLLYSLLATLFLGQIFVTRLDVIPSFMGLLSIYAFMKARWVQSVFWVCLGFFTKGYLLLLGPLFGIFLLKEKKYKVLTLSFLGIILVLVGGSALLGNLTQGRYYDSFQFHASRGIQIESLYSSFWMLMSLFWGERIFSYTAHNSINLGSTHIYWLLNLSKILQPLLLLGFYFYCFKKLLSRVEIPSSLRNLIILESSCLLIFLFILTFKVFSAQFIIWLIPLLFLMPLAQKRHFILLFLLTLLLTQIIFPSFYWMLSDTLHPFAMTLLIIRNLIFLFLFVELFRSSRLRTLSC